MGLTAEFTHRTAFGHCLRAPLGDFFYLDFVFSFVQQCTPRVFPLLSAWMIVRRLLSVLLFGQSGAFHSSGGAVSPIPEGLGALAFSREVGRNGFFQYAIPRGACALFCTIN